MIFDSLSNAKQYAGIHPGIDRILEAAKTYTSENFPADAVVLEADKVILNPGDYTTHPAEGACLEAHRQYIDVMCMIEGCETIYVKNTAQLSDVYKPYDAEIDALLATLDADATPVRLSAGSFVVLFPQDAHAPGCEADGPCAVKKFIGKARIAP